MASGVGALKARDLAAVQGSATLWLKERLIAVPMRRGNPRSSGLSDPSARNSCSQIPNDRPGAAAHHSRLSDARPYHMQNMPRQRRANRIDRRFHGLLSESQFLVFK